MVQNAINFMWYLDQNGFKYTFDKIDEERTGVFLLFSAKNLESIGIFCTFTENEKVVSLESVNLFNFDENTMFKGLMAVNLMNCNSKFTSFCIRGDDNEVIAYSRLIVEQNNVGEILMNAIKIIIDDIDNLYPVFINAKELEL